MPTGNLLALIMTCLCLLKYQYSFLFLMMIFYFFIRKRQVCFVLFVCLFVRLFVCLFACLLFENTTFAIRLFDFAYYDSFGIRYFTFYSNSLVNIALPTFYTIKPSRPCIRSFNHGNCGVHQVQERVCVL